MVKLLKGINQQRSRMQPKPSGQMLTDFITEWVEDISKWPKIKRPDIYTYLVEKPSV